MNSRNIDSADLENFQSWLPTLLEEKPWKWQPLAQKKAKEDGLQLSAREISELLKQAENESRGISIKGRGRRCLQTSEIPALWEGVIATRSACCIVGLPKTHKTQLILNMVGAWWSGEKEYLGRMLNGDCPPLIIVGTDQTEQDWVNSLCRAGLPGHVDPDMKETPLVELWSADQGLALNDEGIKAIRDVAENHHGALIVCDSIRKLVIAPLGIEEKDARLIYPLQKLELELAPYNVSMVYIHHAGKGRANESPITAGAGGTALPGHVSNMIGLQKMSDRNDEHRVQAWIDGRLTRETKFYFDTSVDGFTLLGDGKEMAQLERIKKVEKALTKSQRDVLIALREIYEIEMLSATSEQLCHHIGGSYIKADGSPYLQSMNSRLAALLNKNLVEKRMNSSPSGRTALWSPAKPTFCHKNRDESE